MMARMSVEEKVKSIIVEQLGVDANEVTPEASFVDDLGADSLDTVELVMAFEEAFNIEIPDEAAEKMDVRRNTARTHLRSIFCKTGVTRQTMLVRLLLNSVITLG